MVDEKYCASAGYPDGTVRRFLCRVAMEVCRTGRARRFDVAPNVWQALASETDYASVAGTRATDNGIELLTCTGWVPVPCNAEIASGHGMVLIGEGDDMWQAPLDMEPLL